MNKLWEFLLAEDGPTAVEYAVMLGLILAACLVGIELLGTQTAESFANSRDRMSDAMAAGDL